MKVTIDKINRKEVETKFGNKVNVGVKTREDTVTDINGNEVDVSDKWISHMHDPNKRNVTESWNEGDEVEVRIKTNGDFVNFSPEEGSTGSGKSLIERVAAIEEHLGLNDVKDPSDDF